MNRRALFWLAVVAASLGFAVGAPAADSGDQPSIEVTPQVAKPGEEVTVTGECWGDCDGSPVPGEVMLSLRDKGLDEDLTERVKPEDDGSFTLDVELPEDLERGESYKLVAESPDGQLRARDEVRVARRDPDGDQNAGGGDKSGNRDNGDDRPERARDRDQDDCQPPTDTDSAADDPGAEGQDQSEACPAPPPTAPAGSSVLGESEDSDGGSDGDSGNRSSDDDGENDRGGGDGRDGDNRDRKGDNDNDRDDDSGDDGDDGEDDDSGGGGGGKDRGKDGASAPALASDTVRSAAGPAPDDLRRPVPWALIGVLGGLFAIGLGATYHLVGRWAPDPADVG